MDKKALEQMIASGTDNAMLRYTLGTLNFKEGALEEALAHLEKGLEMDAGHSASWKTYARVLMEMGRNADAMAAYEKGIAVAEARGDIQAVKEMKVFLKRLSK